MADKEVAYLMEAEILENFRFNLQLLRASRELSGTTLATELGMRNSRIHDFAGTKMPPKLEDIIRIATYFDIKISDLLEQKLTIKIPSKESK